MVQLICEKGHRFEKSSSCRTCPTCERQRLKNLLPGLAAPAKRALLARTTANITAKPITITGITAANKVYDSNTTATIDVASIGGYIAGDDLSISAITGTFGQEHIGTGIAVSFSDITYAGSDKEN